MKKKFIIVALLSFTFLLASSAWSIPSSSTLVYSLRQRQAVEIRRIQPDRYVVALCDLKKNQNPLNLEKLDKQQCHLLSPHFFAEDELETLFVHLQSRIEDRLNTADHGRFLLLNFAGLGVYTSTSLFYRMLRNIKSFEWNVTVMAELVLGIIAADALTRWYLSLYNQGRSFDAMLAALGNMDENSKKMVDVNSNSWFLFISELRESLVAFDEPHPT